MRNVGLIMMIMLLMLGSTTLAVDWTPQGNINMRGWYSMIQAIDVNATGEMNAATLNTGQGDYELYAMNQDVESTDAVVFATVDTGQGANELFDMNQNVLTTSAVTYLTVDTGQGANELYDMNQNVLTTSTVTFDDVIVTGFTNGSVLFITDDGKIAQDNANFYWDNEDNRLAIGSTAAMRNILQTVTSDNKIDIDATKAVMAVRNTDLTNDNLGIFSFQTIDDVGSTVTSGARLITRFLNHSNNMVSADFSIETTHEGTRTQRLWVKSDGDVGISTSTPATKLDVNGTITATALNTGQGANELYAMNQDVESTDDVTFNLLSANQTWVHQSYPAACPGSGAIIQLGDSVTCADLWVDVAGDTMAGTLDMDGNTITNVDGLTDSSGNFDGVNLTGEGLVGYWGFEADGIAYDSSLQGNDGTVTGASWTKDGRYGGAYSFDGDGDYINCGNDTSLNFEGSDAFSFGVWLKRTGISTTQMILTKKIWGGDYNGYQFEITSSNRVRVQLRENSTSMIQIDEDNPSLISITDWYYVTMVYDGSSSASGIKIYVDGESRVITETIDTLTGSMKSTNDFQIGTIGSNLYNINGTMDEVRIYNRSLSETEIRTLFLLGRPDQTPTGHLLPKAGGTLTGGLTMGGALNMNSNGITNSGDITLVAAGNKFASSNDVVTMGENIGVISLAKTIGVKDAGGAAYLNYLGYDGAGLFTKTLTVNQDTNAKGLYIDSEATSAANYGLDVNTGQGATAASFQYGTDIGYGLVRIGADPNVTSTTTGQSDFYRNLASTHTARPMVSIRQDHASDDQNALKIQQDGTGEGLHINQDGAGTGLKIAQASSTTGAFLAIRDGSQTFTSILREDTSPAGTNYFYRNLAAASTAGPVMNVVQDNTGDDQPALKIQQDGTGNALYIIQNGATPATDVGGAISILNTDNPNAALSIFTNEDAAASRELVQITVDNPLYDRDVLDIRNDGVGTTLKIDNNNNGRNIFIDQDILNKVDTSAGLEFRRTFTVNDAGSYTANDDMMYLSLEKTESSGTIALTGNVLQLKNAGTGAGLKIDQNGNGKAISIDSESTTATAVEIEPDTLTSGSGLIVDTASSGFTGATSGGLVVVKVDDVSATGTALSVRQDGTGTAQKIDQNGNGIALNIDSEATTAAGIDIAMVDATETGVSTNGIIEAGSYKAGGSAGLTGTATVRDSGGAADCNLVFTGGILTSTTCSWA